MNAMPLKRLKEGFNTSLKYIDNDNEPLPQSSGTSYLNRYK